MKKLILFALLFSGLTVQAQTDPDIWKLDLENRGYTVDETTRESLTLILIKLSGDTVGIIESAGREGIYILRERLEGGKSLLPCLTTTQRDTLDFKLGHQIINVTNDSIVECWNGVIWLALSGDVRAHGDMHVSDSSIALDMTQNIYAHVTNVSNTLFTADHLKNVTSGGDSLVIDLAGLYKVDVHLSIEGSSGDIYESVIAIDNVINNDHKATRKTSTNDVGDMSFSGLYQLTASQSVKIMIRNTEGNNDATIINACLVVNRIDD